MPLKIVVASLAPVKLRAVSQAFDRLAVEGSIIGDEGVEVVGVAADSRVAAQPFGMSEAHTGAANRLGAAMLAQPDADYWVSIENAVQLLPGKVSFDQAAVLVQRGDGASAFAASAGVEVPTDLAQTARRTKRTVGELLQERTGCDKQDPHIELTAGLVSRADLLAEAVYVAVGTAERK